jgi:hypothetical protein
VLLVSRGPDVNVNFISHPYREEKGFGVDIGDDVAEIACSESGVYVIIISETVGDEACADASSIRVGVTLRCTQLERTKVRIKIEIVCFNFMIPF